MDMTQVQGHLQAKARELGLAFDTADSQLYLLEIQFHTPLMVARYKTDVPVPGLPNLDGILQYASFYWCARACAVEHPALATHYLWQVNEALEGRGWVDFPIPLRSVPVDHPGTKEVRRLYDCSVGLPVDPSSGQTCYPVGGDLHGPEGLRFRRSVDSLPLRRRVVQPQEVYKPIRLLSKVDPSRGATKALDNRMYTLVVGAYRFLFRGDPIWVERLLRRLQGDGVGLGKKAALAYGRIASIRVEPARDQACATLGHVLSEEHKQSMNVDPATVVIALLKNIPSDVLFGWCAQGKHNTELLGSPNPKVLSIIPILGGYTPPFWLKTRQTLVAQYGSLLYGQA